MNILVVGLGSIGRRHAQNFSKLGCDVYGFDINDSRVDEAKLAVHDLIAWNTLDDALDSKHWGGIVIATPPAFHVKQLLQCAGTPILMEKNLCLDYGETKPVDSVLKRKELGLNRVMMGYTWRWWKSISDIKTLLPKIGDIRQVEFTMSANLHDWHPYEPVEQFYAAERGGVLNEAHWHDIMLWFFGWPKAVYASYDKISDLPIETPDVLDSIFYYDGFRVNLHYDLIKRPHERSMRIVGERGTLEWEPDVIRLSNLANGGWTEYRNDWQRNDMFMEMARDFLTYSDGHIDALCDLQDGINVMKLLHHTKESNDSQRTVKIES